MRRHLPIATLLLGLSALVAAPAAEAGGLYLVGKLGSSDISVDPELGFSQILDGDDNSASYGFGYRLGGRNSIQAEFHDLGTVEFQSVCGVEEPDCIPQVLPVEAEGSAVSLSLLSHLLLTKRIRGYVKLGVISWDSDISAVGDLAGDFINQTSAEDLIYGAGLRVDLPGPVDAFAEYERIADIFDTVAIGATWGF